MGQLEGKTAVVLGAASEGNMGQTIARLFAKEGAKVMVAGRKEAPLAALAAMADEHRILDLKTLHLVEALRRRRPSGALHTYSRAGPARAGLGRLESGVSGCRVGRAR